MENLQRQPPLADQVVELLLKRIPDGVYPPSTRLPSESELAEEFGVSRATIRSALSTLAANNLVRRRQGTGTFVSHLTQVSNPLNEVIDYQELIEGQGFTYRYEHLNAEVRPAGPDIAAALVLDSGPLILVVKKAFLADGELLIYTVNIIPVWVIESHVPLDRAIRPGATEPLFEFLEMQCTQRVEAYRATLRPDIARHVEITDPRFPVDPHLPVLVIEEIGYNAADQPVLYEVEYLFGDRMKFELIRRHR